MTDAEFVDKLKGEGFKRAEVVWVASKNKVGVLAVLQDGRMQSVQFDNVPWGNREWQEKALEVLMSWKNWISLKDAYQKKKQNIP